MRGLIPDINLSTLLRGPRKWALSGAIVLVTVCAVRVSLFALVPPGEGKIVREFDFPKGSSLRRLADELEKGGCCAAPACSASMPE